MKKQIFGILLLLSIVTNLCADEEITKKRVLIGAPIRQKPAILKEFLNSLLELTTNTFTADFCFVDDNVQDESKNLLIEFAKDSKGRVFISQAQSNDVYVCNEQTHYWNEAIIWKVARFKDQIFEFTLEHNYDYVFLVDSDIVMHPNTIEQLIRDNKDIVSEIFWTHWQPNSPKSPQVWLYDTFTQYETHCGEQLSGEEVHRRHNDFICMLLNPGVYDVGGLGACTLISKRALEKGARFKKVKNITFWGEDRHFCIRAAALGLDLCVDTHYPAYHIYRESDLAGVAQYKENCRNGVYQI